MEIRRVRCRSVRSPFGTRPGPREGVAIMCAQYCHQFKKKKKEIRTYRTNRFIAHGAIIISRHKVGVHGARVRTIAEHAVYHSAWAQYASKSRTEKYMFYHITIQYNTNKRPQQTKL